MLAKLPGSKHQPGCSGGVLCQMPTVVTLCHTVFRMHCPCVLALSEQCPKRQLQRRIGDFLVLGLSLKAARICECKRNFQPCVHFAECEPFMSPSFARQLARGRLYRDMSRSSARRQGSSHALSHRCRCCRTEPAHPNCINSVRRNLTTPVLRSLTAANPSADDLHPGCRTNEANIHSARPRRLDCSLTHILLTSSARWCGLCGAVSDPCSC